MKLSRSLSTLTLKALFLVAILLSNMYVECSEKIKMQKTLSKYERLNSKSKYSSKKFVRRSSNKSKMDLMGKFKLLLVGFLANIAIKAVSAKEGDSIDEMVGSAVDKCFNSTVHEFTEIKKKMIKDSPCNTDAVKEAIGSQYDEIQVKCAELETTMKMDSNEFSTFNVLIGKMKDVFSTKTEYIEKYKKFKEDKDKLEDLNKIYTKIYKTKFKDIKNDKSGLYDEKVKKVAKILYDDIDGIIKDTSLCEALRNCNPLGMTDYLKIIWGAIVGFMKCVTTVEINNSSWNSIQAVVQKIVNALGVGVLTTIAAGIFPGILLGLLTKFVINNWSELKKFYKSFLKLRAHDEDAANAEKDLWNAIGSILSGLFYTLIGMRRRKIKKFRKFDTKLY